MISPRASARLALAIGSIVVAGCASAGATNAASSVAGAGYVLDRLYFGRAIGDTGLVSDSAWSAFVRDEVTPRFADGITTWRAEGQWRSANGAIVREPSVVLEVLHHPSARDDSAIARITDEYKRRFRQEAVLRLTTPVRASF